MLKATVPDTCSLIELVSAEPSDRPVLANLLQLYLYDFSEFMGWDVSENGRFGENDLDGCWTLPHRHPFIFRVDGKLAGFSIIDEKSDITGATDVNDVAEFFVIRKWRRQGIGARVAVQHFDRFPGNWEVRELEPNVDGIAFWRRVIDQYTSGNYLERKMPVHGRMSYVQFFSSSPKATSSAETRLEPS